MTKCTFCRNDIVLYSELQDSFIKINHRFYHLECAVKVKSNGTMDDYPEEIFRKIQYISPTRKKFHATDNITADHSSKKDLIIQNVNSNGNNILEFLAQRWSERDPNCNLLEDWIKKIDPNISILKTPLNGNRVSGIAQRNDDKNNMEINLSMHGNGIQNSIIIISAILFSSKGSTIIIEKPETHLHSKSIEILVDLFNYAVNHLNKQIIIVTHSWDVLRAYCSDIGTGTSRGNQHEIAKSEDFKLITFSDSLGESKIKEYDLTNKKFSDVVSDFKKLWG